MPTVISDLVISGDRRVIRRQVIIKFLEEEPGTGTGENSSKYIYYVERLYDGSRIFLRRPAPLNKGVDFEVNVENIKFRDRGKVTMPSHADIINDLSCKKEDNGNEYRKVQLIIEKLYNCEMVTDNDYRDISFECGHPIEAILKSIKWLFIEQDVTYWNWSGRAMLYNKLKDEELV